MKKTLLLFLFAQLIAQAQPRTKQLLMEGHGPPIVLLHGGQFDMTAYADHAKLLADSFTVIRLQQFNVQYANEGKTLPATYSVKTESAAILATLDSLRLTEPVILVGHSYGGVIAFDVALNHPDRVRSLVLIEAPLYDLARQKGQLTQQMKAINELTSHFTPDAQITEEMLKTFRCKLANCDGMDIRQHPMWPRWVKQKDRLRGLSAAATYTVDLTKLRAFQKPVLIITGSTTIDPNKVTDKLLAQAFANAKTGSLPGDHIAVYKNADTFVQLLKAFLR